MTEASEMVDPAWNWDQPVYLRCDCHTPYHAVVIDKDPDIAGFLNVSVVSTRNGSIWHRLKWAAVHVFKREDLVCADLILGKAEVSRLFDFLRASLHEGEAQR